MDVDEIIKHEIIKQQSNDEIMTNVNTLDQEIEQFLTFVLKVPWSTYKNRIPISINEDNTTPTYYLKRLEILIDLIITDTIRDHVKGLIVITANDGEIQIDRKQQNNKIKNNIEENESKILNDDDDDDDVPMCPKPNIIPVQSSIKGSILYLLNAYRLAWSYNRNSLKLGKDEVLKILQEKIFDYSIIITTNITSDNDRSLLQLLYDNMISDDFLQNLVEISYNKGTFSNIFTPILNYLYLDMRAACVDKVLNTSPLTILKQLVCIIIKVNDQIVRPFCDLLSNLKNFLPELCTKNAMGREVSKICFLSPFLSLSVFVEDNPKLAENYLSTQNIFDKIMATSLQTELDCARSLLHNILHTLLLNMESRNKVLKYIATIISTNAKRTQFNAEEKLLARDGFMLNFMAVLQQLSVKIKLNRVDQLYLFHPDNLLSIENDTKLRFSQKEYEDWLQEISKYFII